jgi:ATP-dependent helicase/nuclease subunit A
MVDDIGLFAWAAAQVGGNEEAGNLAKAIELIRAAQSEFATILDVLNFVKDLIDKTAAYDSLPSRPYDSSVVRLMNLHKVKGLEAAHVYLANPTGKMNHPVDLHVDRSSGRVRGYVAIQAAGGFRGKELATCMDWPRIAKEEERYHQAEQIRLLYVAATRAKNSLIISLKKAKSDKSNSKNFWGFFEVALNACLRIQELSTQPIPMKTPVSVDIQQFELAMARVIPSWQSIVQPSYAMESVKAATVEDQPFAGESDPYGQEWGTVIHILLERLMSQPGADIHRLAETFLHENGVPLERLDEAIETAQRVTASAIWQRAQQSAHIYTEIPFYRLAAAAAGSVPVMKRGVMDLIFKEPTGWVIVDYKTDLLAKTNPSKLIKRYQPQLRAYAQEWQILTGEAVIETGLFFIRTSQYEPVA